MSQESEQDFIEEIKKLEEEFVNAVKNKSPSTANGRWKSIAITHIEEARNAIMRSLEKV
jgi:hypothetical protein